MGTKWENVDYHTVRNDVHPHTGHSFLSGVSFNSSNSNTVSQYLQLTGLSSIGSVTVPRGDRKIIVIMIIVITLVVKVVDSIDVVLSIKQAVPRPRFIGGVNIFSNRRFSL